MQPRYGAAAVLKSKAASEIFTSGILNERFAEIPCLYEILPGISFVHATNIRTELDGNTVTYRTEF